MSDNEGPEIASVGANGTLHEAVVTTIDSEYEARKDLYSKMKAAKFLFSDRVRFLISSDSSGAFGTKKTKFAKRPSNRRGVGKLRDVVNLPLDTIWEIATHLEPLDLLQISRVNKDFASLFLSLKTRSIWRNVLKQAYHDIPECPIDMTEPQFASLILEKFCMACGDTRSDFTSFSLRVRLCFDCRSINIISECAIEKLLHHNHRLMSIVPCQGKYYSDVPDEMLCIKNELEDILKFPRDASSDSMAKLVVGIDMSGRSIFEWLNVLQEREEDQATIAAETRTQIIFQKMEELGWESRYYPQGGSRYYPQDIQLKARWNDFIYQQKSFNEKGWKITKKKLEGIYLKSKQNIIAADLHDKFKLRYYKWVSSLDDQDKETMPGWMDIKPLPCVANFLKKRWKHDIAEEEWALLIPNILEQVEPIKVRIQDLIIAQVKKTKPSLFKPGNSHSDNLMVLRRASCLFICNCNACKGSRAWLRPYPDIVEHSCLIAILHKEQVWSTKMQDFDGDILDLAEGILEALGFSPDIQRDDLAGFDKKFVCRCVHTSFKWRLLSFKFEELVSHIYSEKYWYKKIMPEYITKGEENVAALLVNDHDLSRLPELVSIEDMEEDA